MKALELLPKSSQYKKWSLPSKYSLWGLVVGIIALVISLFPKQSVLEQVAQEEYRPKVQLMGVTLEKWLGESEPFLTLHFENNSKGPAQKLAVDIYDGNDKIVIERLSGSNMLNSGNFALQPAQNLGIPLISVSELKGLLSAKEKRGQIVGFGLNPEVPEKIKAKLHEKYAKDTSVYYSVNSYPFFAQFSYQGITNTDSQNTTGFYVYLDNTEED
ncbi:hypothetical protein ACLO87_07940 [Paenalcaligenes sp. Me52]|uniref:hypothetical protein n=1 Tax=Paenalcaligenes sp. Me52 TaxID=3392038 RepID=UPI003D268C63